MGNTATSVRPTGHGRGGLAGLAGLPSLRGMTPAEARAAQVLGKAWDTADVVELAIEWVGTGCDSPALLDLAGSDWDDPFLPTLWDLALDDLAAAHPAPSTARRRVAAYLARRRRIAMRATLVPAPRGPSAGS